MACLIATSNSVSGSTLPSCWLRSVPRSSRPLSADSADGSPSQRDPLRSPKVPIPRDQRHLVNDARRPDQLVRGIASNVEPSAHPGDVGCDRPDMHGSQGPHDLPIVEVNLDPTELG